MKNDQNDETNPNIPFVFMFDHSKCLNMELLASFDKMNSEFVWEIIPIIFPLIQNNLVMH